MYMVYHVCVVYHVYVLLRVLAEEIFKSGSGDPAEQTEMSI